LKRYRIGHTIIRWIRETLEGRRTNAALGGVSRIIAVVRGCPQGDVLSPLLWNLVVYELLVGLNQGDLRSRICGHVF
jgi:hypothetical protein